MSSFLRSFSPYTGEPRPPVVPASTHAAHPLIAHHVPQRNQPAPDNAAANDAAQHFAGQSLWPSQGEPSRLAGLVQPVAPQSIKLVEIRCNASSNNIHMQDTAITALQSLVPANVKGLVVKNFWRQSEGVSCLGLQMTNLRFLRILDVDVQSYPLADSLVGIPTLEQIKVRFGPTHPPCWLPQSKEVINCGKVWRDVSLHLTTPIMDLYIDHCEPWHAPVLTTMLNSNKPMIRSLYLNTNQSEIGWFNALRYGMQSLPGLQKVQHLAFAHADPCRHIWNIDAFTDACCNMKMWPKLNTLSFHHIMLTEAHLGPLATAVRQIKNLQKLSIIVRFLNHPLEQNAQSIQTFLSTCMGTDSNKPFRLTVYVDTVVRMNEGSHSNPQFHQIALPWLQNTLECHITDMQWPHVTCEMAPIEAPSLASHYPEFAHVS